MIDWSQAITAEQKMIATAAIEVAQTNAEAAAYLASTDWYAARAFECGKPMPPDIADARQAARDRIVKI